jgi:hypothetical protein
VALVHAHFEAVPGLGTLAVGRFARGDAQGLGGHAHGALDGQLLVLGTRNQVAAHLRVSISNSRLGRTFSRDPTWRDDSVMRMRWLLTGISTSFLVLICMRISV